MKSSEEKKEIAELYNAYQRIAKIMELLLVTAGLNAIYSKE